LLDKKREARFARRHHLRYRQARFNNRTSSKKEGWLPPSIQHRIDSHVRLVENVTKILPITEIIVEIGIFDTQKISNPEISGEEYQNGQMKGFDNVKAFVKFRDKYKCQQCGREEHLEVHHIQHREDGGSDRPDNLICLCHECHYKHHNKGLVLKKFRNFNKKNSDTLRDASAMNLIKDKILSELRNRFPNIPIRKTYGIITAKNRRQNNVDKSHANDAFIIAKNFDAKPLEYMFKGIQVRRHNRRIHKDNILKGNNRKLNQAPHLVFGFALNDRVKFNKIECFVHGRRSKGYFVLKDIDGNTIHNSAQMKKIKLISHENGILLKRISKSRKDSADFHSDAEDVAVSSARLL
jgi:5-methylcytosine-specific restriction endonuclease McrA